MVRVGWLRCCVHDVDYPGDAACPLCEGERWCRECVREFEFARSGGGKRLRLTANE